MITRESSGQAGLRRAQNSQERGMVTMSTESLNLDTVEMPKVPEVLHLFGVPGKQAYRRLTQEIESGADNLEIIRDYEKGAELFESYVAETENEQTKAYAETAADCEAEAEADEKAKAAELQAIEDKFAKNEAEREARLSAAKAAVLETADGLELPTDEDRADAVVGWDLARASLEDFKRRAIKSLQNRKVKNPDYDPTVEGSAELVDVEALLNSIQFPEIGIGKKPTGQRGGTAGWKPRWTKAVVDGTALNPATSGAVAKHIGITVDNLLKSLQRLYSRESVDAANDGTEYSFTVPVEKEGTQTTYSVMLVK